MVAKLTTSHDWLRVVATDAVKNKISLTTSRSGEKCSGSGVTMDTMKAAITAFSKVITKKTGQKTGERMQAVLGVAQKSTTMEEYVAALEALASA